MSSHPLLELIRDADRAITAEDFDALMQFYAEDATLVVTPGRSAKGKDEIRRAFVEIADYFEHRLVVDQGETVIVEGGDTALVVMETILRMAGGDGSAPSMTRRATYVFRSGADGKWLCVIDNSYGTDLLGAQ